MLGIGEVWYFSGKEGVFSRNDNSITVLDQQHVLVLMNTTLGKKYHLHVKT
jgi:hypothetical protein